MQVECCVEVEILVDSSLHGSRTFNGNRLFSGSSTENKTTAENSTSTKNSTSIARLKVAGYRFQHFPRLRFRLVIITTLNQLMLQSWCQTND